MRRRFAQRGRNEGFMVLLNNEHCTSIKSACCGAQQESCSGCGRSLHRDGAAVTNQAHVGTYTLNGWGRPPWLLHGHD
jgi:transposase